jgi:hypothetical protein
MYYLSMNHVAVTVLLPTTILPQFALDPAFDALSHTSDRFDCQIAQFQQFTRYVITVVKSY